MLKSRLFLAGFLALAAGCANVAEEPSSSTDSNLIAPNDVSLELGSTTPSVGLGTSVDLDVTVTPAEGFADSVDLTVEGLPVGVTAAPVSVSLADGPVQAKVKLVSAHTAHVTPKNTTVPIKVVATSGKVATSVAAEFKVEPKVTIYIPVNIQALYQAAGGPLREEWGAAFGPAFQPLRTQADNPIVISIFNNDSKAHIIHGPGGSFPHGDFRELVQPNAYEILNGVIRTRTMKVGNSATAYIHGESNSTNATFKVVIGATPDAR